MTDPYVYPGTDVLRNTPGILDRHQLQALETRVATLTVAQLGVSELAGSYDLAHLQAFHREIFGPVYPWAGELRTVAIAKTQMFCLPQHLDSYAADIFGRLARDDHLRGRDRDGFIDGLTEVWADVNALHPFREGNGRSTRAFLHQLARDAGHPLSWQGLGEHANVSAAIASLNGDNRELRALVAAHLLPAAPARKASDLPSRLRPGAAPSTPPPKTDDFGAPATGPQSSAGPVAPTSRAAKSLQTLLERNAQPRPPRPASGTASQATPPPAPGNSPGRGR